MKLHRRPLSATGVGWLALSTSILAGSTFNVFAKMLSIHLSPLSLVFISESLVLLFVLLSFGIIPILQTYASLGRSSILQLCAIGCLSGIVGPGLWFTGLSITSAVNANFFGKAEMLFVLLFAGVLLHERLKRPQFLAGASITAGLVIIALHGFTEAITPRIGDFLIILATISFAVSNTIYSKYLHHVPSHIALCSRSIVAVGAFFLVSPFIPHSLYGEVSLFPFVLIPALIGFGFISRFINSVAFYESIERLPMSSIALVGSVDVILSTIVANAMLGEHVRWYHFLGGGFIILGTLLLELLHEPPSKHAAEQRQLRHRIT